MRQRSIELHRKRIHSAGKSRIFQRLIDTCIVCVIGRIEDHVLLYGTREYLEVLEDCTDGVAVCLEVVISDVHAVSEDLAFRRIIKAHQELDERRLTGTVVADERDLFSGLYLHGDIRKDRREILLIGESHILKDQFF